MFFLYYFDRILILAAIVPAIFLLVKIYQADRSEKEPPQLLGSLILRGVERLKNLFRGSKSRSEIVATFLAILEMCKTNAGTLEDDVSGENPNVRLLEVKGREEV